jgi:selenocysteine lyase/cysteine desulfurase
MVVPERFEFGTLPYEIMAGVTASIDYVSNLDRTATGSRRQKIVQSMKALEDYERELFKYLEDNLKALPGITMYGKAKNRTPTCYFNFAGVNGADLYKHMASLKVNLPAHNFYALEVSRAIGLGDTGAIRAGLAPYSTKDDVDRLVSGIKQFLAKAA